MISETTQRRRAGKLPQHLHEQYSADARAGLSDIALARKYDISERTATNWRLRLVGARSEKENPAALTGAPGDVNPEGGHVQLHHTLPDAAGSGDAHEVS